ncbi:MAG: hypothetical protein ABIH83_04295 [Candidatus Micrarchaeota archaeon]
MKSRKAQSSTEFLISLILIIIILVVMYELSFDMSLRKDLIASQYEGDKISAKIARTIDWVAITGPGTSIIFSAGAYPSQFIIISGSEVIAFGQSNSTMSISPTLAGNAQQTSYFSSNQNLNVSFNGTNVTVTQMG